MTDWLAAIQNLLKNPILVGVGSVLVLIAGFFLRKWAMPWLQKAKDQSNQNEVVEQSKKSQDENQKMNDEVDKIFG